MGGFERERRQEGRPPAWRSSEGRMWERTPQARREGKDHLTGYQPHGKEKSQRPREAARMGGAYGDVSVGVSRKKELTLVVSARRSREGPAARREEQTLLGNSARKMNLARGDFRVNAHDPEKSAVAYRESHKKSSRFMLERFKEMMRTREQHTLAQQVPFLNRREEREELRRLQSLGERLQAKGGPQARAAQRKVEARKQALHQQLTEKGVQERRLRLLLEKAREESRRRAGEVERPDWQLPAGPEQAPPPPEEGEGRNRGPLEELADVLLGALLGEEPPAPEPEGGPVPAGGEAEEKI